MRVLVSAIVVALALATAFPASARTVRRDGGSFERAIVMRQATTREGVAAEYVYLRQAYPGWRRVMQELIHRGPRSYDRLTIVSPSGERRQFYFDVTNFFGRL